MGWWRFFFSSHRRGDVSIPYSYDACVEQLAPARNLQVDREESRAQHVLHVRMCRPAPKHPYRYFVATMLCIRGGSEFPTFTLLNTSTSSPVCRARDLRLTFETWELEVHMFSTMFSALSWAEGNLNVFVLLWTIAMSMVWVHLVQFIATNFVRHTGRFCSFPVSRGGPARCYTVSDRIRPPPHPAEASKAWM